MKFSITFADNSVYFSPIFDILYGINMIPIVIFKKILLFLAVVLLNSVGYKAAQIIRPTGILTMTWIDPLIPYISTFVIPYALYLPVLILPFILYWNDYKKYRTMALSLAAVLAASIIIYLIFQTEMTRYEPSQNNIFDSFVSAIQHADAPVNALPSLHVSIPLMITFFVYIRSRKMGICLLPVTILIILSTVFIKQHAVLDILGGIILATIVFRMRKHIEKL